jgi:integrase/recombinase XerD
MGSYVSPDPLVADFATYLRLELGRSGRTAEEYGRDLDLFRAFLGGTPLIRASTSEIRRFVMELMGQRKYKAVAVRRKLAAIKAFYRYLRREGRRKDDPAFDIPSPKADRLLPRVLSEKEVAKVIGTKVAGRTDEQRLRDLAMMELLYASGIRRAELVGLNVEDVDLERRMMRVVGKGSKERVVLINQAATDAMRAYLGVRPRSADPAFFLSRRKRRLSARQAWEIFSTFVRLSGIAKHATPHVMRHSFATHLLENGADLVTIKELLGHESLSTTQIYTNVAIDHIRKTYDNAHPRDRQDR